MAVVFGGSLGCFYCRSLFCRRVRRCWRLFPLGFLCWLKACLGIHYRFTHYVGAARQVGKKSRRISGGIQTTTSPSRPCTATSSRRPGPAKSEGFPAVNEQFQQPRFSTRVICCGSAVNASVGVITLVVAGANKFMHKFPGAELTLSSCWRRCGIFAPDWFLLTLPSSTLPVH